MRICVGVLVLVLGLTGLVQAAVDIQITEIYGGTGPDWEEDATFPILPEWFEITNFGDTAADLVINPLYYDDESATASYDDQLMGVNSIAPGESVIFLVDFESDMADGTYATALANFHTAFGDLTGVQIGYVDNHGGGLGGRGDSMYIFDGNDYYANVVDTEGYGHQEERDLESTHVSLPDGTWRGWDNYVATPLVLTNTDLAGFGGGTLGDLGYGLPCHQVPGSDRLPVDGRVRR